MKIKISNQQKTVKINTKELKRDIKKIMCLLGITDYEIYFFFTDNKTIKDINCRFLARDYPTDVISFPLRDESSVFFLGEVIISVERALEVSSKLGLPFLKELYLYVVHGLLHLIGYRDDKKNLKKIMDSRQQEILKKLPLIN